MNDGVSSAVTEVGPDGFTLIRPIQDWKQFMQKAIASGNPGAHIARDLLLWEAEMNPPKRKAHRQRKAQEG